MKKKYKTLTKRLATLTLTALIVFSSIFSSYSMTANAEVNLDVNVDLNDIALLQLVEGGLITAGELAGAAIGSFIAPGAGTVLGGLAGGVATKTLINSSLNKKLDWFANSNKTGQTTNNDGRTYNYQYNTGKETTQNTTNYNQTKNMSLYNETKTWNNTTNKYDYSYNWYNPITNKYDVTNEYTYNTTYNTYHYQTYNIDVTNNYNYTTNYYIQDNRTYVSYYIINTCEETGEEENTYVEMYYQLPDGRNSLNLTVDDIKGMYFPSNYSKYISVAEDDGTTLGLWHLDGDLKDSSYWGNTAGSSYSNVYTDGLYSTGKKFSDSDNDFIELKLDKVDLPDSWTLEWCEYVPSTSCTDDFGNLKLVLYNPVGDNTSSEGSVQYKNLFYDMTDYTFDLRYDNYFSLNDSGKLYEPSSGFFVPYAITFDGSNYSFYRNGVLVNEFDFSNKDITAKLPDSTPTTYKIGELDFSPFGTKIDNDSIVFSTEPLQFSAKSKDFQLIHVNRSNDPILRYYTYFYYNVYMRSHVNSIIDEVRLSKGVLYSGSSYTPQSQPYTTNTVLAVPSNPEKHEIAFKTNTNISDVRFGGARPTYPTNGYVYVALDSNHEVESVQQYQEDGWYEIESAIYLGTDWVGYKGFDMDYLGIDTSDSNTGGDTGGGSDSGDTGDTGDTGDSGGGTGFGDILDGIGKFLNTILSLIGKLIGMVSDFVSSALSLFETLTVFTDGFSQFLSGAFGFLPTEAITVIVSGITTIVILAIIKFLRG